jgi:uncharacterized phiE125 gp8 family phage protein
MSTKPITAPAEEPISLDEAKNHLRIDTSPVTPHPDDNLVTRKIKEARHWCEDFQNRAYITQIWKQYLDRFPCRNYIEIPLPPLQSIVSLSYKDETGILQAVSFLDPSGTSLLETDDYIVDIASEPGRLVLKDNKSWPWTSRDVQSVQIIFVAGYGAASEVPDDYKAAIYLKLSDFYENRGDGDSASEDAAKSLLWPDRIISI